MSWLKKIFFLLLLYCKLATVNCQLTPYWQQQVNYTIDVSLNDIEHTLDGFTKIQYTNRSPDTLSFIWFHVWPNAYKNDQTAFSEQLLQNGRTDFYFSGKDEKGYINRLDFRVDGEEAAMQDHPLYIDVIKIILPHPLPPGKQIEITTPFHEKLPLNFSRGGHIGQSYQITQWYPKPAVYDHKGWHEMPYLDQGEFYSEFGNFNVRITLPENYVVAATGELQNEDEKKWLLEVNKGQDTRHKVQETKPRIQNTKNKAGSGKLQNQILTGLTPPSAKQTKTLVYKQNNIHDFAWFADKRFTVDYDTVQLPSGRIINAYSFYLPSENTTWKNSTHYIKDAVGFRSALIGEYPYNTISVVEGHSGTLKGMEYPTISIISSAMPGRELDMLIEHEVGHNWFYAALGSNERSYPWMDEGMDTYYDKRYQEAKSNGQNPMAKAQATRHKAQEGKNTNTEIQNSNTDDSWLHKKMTDDKEKLFVDIITKEKTDQPIATGSEYFSATNYGLVVYEKAALWMKQLEASLGTRMFDSCMRRYFNDWQFKHPYPEDFKAVVEQISGQKSAGQFALLDKKGPLTPFDQHKKIKPVFLFSTRNTDKVTYINIAPGIGYNMYDKLMIGAIIHNFNLPSNNFQFLLAPLYATGSKQLNGLGAVGYSWHPDNHFKKIEAGISFERFSTKQSLDTNGKKIFENFYKIVPSLQFYFNHDPRSTITSWLDIRTYLIGEKKFNKFGIIAGGDSSVIFPVTEKNSTRYINQLSFNVDNARTLYPYDYQVQVQQGESFYRINLAGNYFFNYAKGGGMKVRVFAAKFGYIGGQNPDAAQYQPKLLAANGQDDYTYSNYFLGRTAATNNPGKPVSNAGIGAQQVMIRDGGLKLRMDLFDFVQGRSENWVAALNFNSTLPKNLLPAKLPLSVFFDIGTYAEGWQNNPPTSKFLYTGGLQLTLFKKILNIYAPLIYSKDFKDQLKTLGKDNTFWKRLTFSIDIQNIHFRKIFGNIPY
jgi:hypothetical protein